ncbi:hypothetical protein ACIRBX_14110 [Kitasatospora sp. NPDC096147]|uniref:hypothetical protein n=1 Tax=Kitasatospora sp. NPDC096147 TaxID=3364093 RepID=UPI00382A5A86
MTDFPSARRPQPAGPAAGLRLHATVLREHEERLLKSLAALGWEGPQAEAFREQVAELAARCGTAADGLAGSAMRLAGPAEVPAGIADVRSDALHDPGDRSRDGGVTGGRDGAAVGWNGG